MEQKKSILIVDDHDIVRRGILGLIKEKLPFLIQYEAESYAKALEILKTESIHLIILDLNLPDGNAEVLVSSLKKKFDRIPIIVFSMFPKEIMELPMKKLGVDAYINKSENPFKLIEAIDKIFYRVSHKIEEESTEIIENPFEELSPQELSVMFLLLEGKTNRDIMSTMNIGASTVSTYKNRIFTKLNVTNISQLVKLAVQFKLYHIS